MRKKSIIGDIVTFVILILIILTVIVIKFDSLKELKNLIKPNKNDNIINIENTDKNIDKEIETDKNKETGMDKNNSTSNEKDNTSNSEIKENDKETSNNNYKKTIVVKDGNLYDKNSNKPFQIIGINFDNNTWNPKITAINTGHDDTSYNELKAMGFNTIRFGLAYNMTIQDNFFQWLDNNIKQAKDAGLKIILDMHTSHEGIQLRDKDATYRFWQSEQLQKEFIDTWVKIASHYSKEDTIIMYDLLNEPLVIINEGQNADDLYYKFISKLVESIRKVDNQTIICIEGYNSSIYKYNEKIDETTYVANITNSSNVIKKIKDTNIVFDVHSYSPTEYTFQTNDDPISYSDLYDVKDRKEWTENSEYYIIESSSLNEWFMYESDLYKINNSNTNYGNIRYTFDKKEQGNSIWFDKIIIEEYDQNKKFIKKIYEFSFDKTKYEWNSYGNQTYEIDSNGYDNIGGSLKLTSKSNQDVLTLRIANTGFSVKVGHYYKIKAYIKSNSLLNDRNSRLSLIFANVGFSGGLRELSDYSFSKYKTFSINNKIPMICNEFGTNYNSIKNSDGSKYLYEVFTAIYKYNVNISLFSYSGFDFGLMYDNTRDFGTNKSKIRQDSYDALYKAINQNTTYNHIFKNINTMKEYSNLKVGDKILVLGEINAGVGKKLEYVISNSSSNNAIKLSNDLYAILK